MLDDPSTVLTNRDLTAEIVAAYVRRNQLTSDQLGTLISAVHRALGQLGTPAAEPVVERTPAVSIRRSIHRDYVVCIECGYRGQILKRHLNTAHGLSVPDYRARWNLPRDHAITALGYSERRSTAAKQIGLGRGDRGASAETMATPEMKTATASPPKRRGRPRSAAASVQGQT
jgi:predicted transcriptional regulator